MANCVTCELIKRRDRDESPLWDSIYRTPSWDIVHAFGTTIEGWIVLVARRHITSVAEDLRGPVRRASEPSTRPRPRDPSRSRPTRRAARPGDLQSDGRVVERGDQC